MQPTNIVGIICSHGCETVDESFVIIPKGIELCPLSNNREALVLNEIITELDLCETVEGRRMLDSSFYSLYTSGSVLRNLLLLFKLTFDREEMKTNFCFTTGIMTYGRIHYKILSALDFNTDMKLRDELMIYHDNEIICKEDIWNRIITIGEALKLITNAGKFGRYIGLFCRSKNSISSKVIPKFLTIELTEDVYHSCFFSKLELFENSIGCDRISKFSLLELASSKLKIRITLTELCRLIREKLSVNNTINSFEFYSTVEIYYTKNIPLECVLFAFEIKFKSLIADLSEIKDSFCGRLLKLLQVFSVGLEKCIKKYQKEAFDNVIFTAEKIVSGQNISPNLRNKIVSYCDKLNV